MSRMAVSTRLRVQSQVRRGEHYVIEEDGVENARVEYDREYIRRDEYAGDLSDVVSAALRVSQSSESCAIRRDEYDGGKYDGDVENDDTLYGESNVE